MLYFGTYLAQKSAMAPPARPDATVAPYNSAGLFIEESAANTVGDSDPLAPKPGNQSPTPDLKGASLQLKSLEQTREPVWHLNVPGQRVAEVAKEGAKPVNTLEQYKFSKDPEVAANFRNVPAFQELTASFLQNMPDSILQKKEITVLYPGGGAHMAPLEFALNLFASGQSKAETVSYIYTDISEDAYETMEGYLEKMEDEGGLKVVDSESVERETGTEKTVTCEVQTACGPKRIRLMYAIGCSEPEKGDHDYYKQAYADQADVFISHDSSDALRTSYFLGSFLSSMKHSPNLAPRAFFVEDDNNDSIHTRWDLLPGKTQAVDKPYGCNYDLPDNDAEDDHLGKAKYSAMAYFPKTDFYQKISDADLEILLWEANTVSFPDEVLRTPEGGVTRRYDADKLAELSRLHCEAFERIAEIDPHLGEALFAHHLRFLNVAALGWDHNAAKQAFSQLDAKFQKKCFEAFLAEKENGILHIKENELEALLPKKAEGGHDLNRFFYGQEAASRTKLSILELAVSAAERDEAMMTRLQAYVKSQFPNFSRIAERMRPVVAEWKTSDNYRNGPYTVHAERQSDDSMKWYNVDEDRTHRTMQSWTRVIEAISPLLPPDNPGGGH